MTGREKCLKGALEKAIKVKDITYGRPESNLSGIANMWSTYLAERFDFHYELIHEDVAHMMVLFKLVRAMRNTEPEDSYVDACGYLACAYECQFGDSDEE